ncbi:MAG: hypothetical protein KJ901_21915 [Gammaproteobacteria bacterium]|nr:hypothetical protein [Gammaproteobacteria bacterium]
MQFEGTTVFASAVGALALMTVLAGCGGGGGGGGSALPVGTGIGTGGAPTQKFAVGGSITGIVNAGPVILGNNGGDLLTLSANGQFSFDRRLNEGDSYRVSVSSVPSTQSCSAMFSEGVVSTANVTSVKIACGPAQRGAFHEAAPMLTPRANHTLIAMPDSSVLAMGGSDLASNPVRSVERYDPASNSWRAAGTLPFPALRAAALLPSNGKILIAGSVAQTQLYDPASQAFTPTGSFANLAASAPLQFVTLLDGRVLASSGSEAQIYEPNTGTWNATAAPSSIHADGGTFTLLSDGKVLAAGGFNHTEAIPDSEVFDPSSQKWTAVGPLAISRTGHTSTLLPNGKVLVIGGLTGTVSHYCACGLRTVAAAELFDPMTNTWSSAGALTTARIGFSATLMTTSQVLVVGGNIQGRTEQIPNDGFRTTIPTPLKSVEAYDPLTNSWRNWGEMQLSRTLHAATLMTDGNLLITGGSAAAFDNQATPDPLEIAWHNEWVIGSEIGW